MSAEAPSLQDLFDKDPLDLTREDLAIMVAAMRKAAEKWAAAQTAGKKQAPPVKDIDLSQLNISF